MKILSIHDGHNASAAVFNNEKLLSAISEERLNREKFYWGFPHQSITEALSIAHVSMKDIDSIAVSHLHTWGYIKRKITKKELFTRQPKIFLGNLYNVLQVCVREIRIRLFALRHGIVTCYFCDHHYAHALSAYYFSGFGDALVVTLDGLGDSLSHTAYSVRSGTWQQITEGGALASAGAFYAAVTEALGFKPNRHEGKIVGLAAMGNPHVVYKEISELFICTDNKLSFVRKSYGDMREVLETLLARNVSREDIAAAAQFVLEETVTSHINVLLQKTGQKYLACAGGVFANVKLNQKILEETSVEDIFIQPAMGDEGLVLGAPFGLLQECISHTEVMEDVYLGNDISLEQTYHIAEKEGYIIRELQNPAEETARLVAEGKIVGWCDGRMEFGPRALGSRSIIADPRNKEVNAILNKRLRRSEFMPFAPSALYERRHDICATTKGEAGMRAALFMTITFTIKEEWRTRVPAVVHVDGTARPQFVTKEINPHYYAVLKAFESQTGVPLFMNTSFNLHEEPIVARADDALRALADDAVDVVVCNNKVAISKK